MKEFNKYGAQIPKVATKSLLNCNGEIQVSEYFAMLFLLGLDCLKKNKVETIERITKVFEGQTPNPITELLNAGKIDALFDSKTFEIFYGQMIFARTIDNVQTYFKEILAEVVLKRPEVLKSKETERLDFILSHSSMEELQAAITEKKVEALFYAGFDKIESFFRERVGIEIFESEDQKADFNSAIKSRNLIVHNRGIITKEYIKNTNIEGLIEGNMIQASYESISKLNISINNLVARIDETLINKFNLDVYKNN